MLVGALRKTYGPNFAKGCADNERLSEVLAKDASLRRDTAGPRGKIGAEL
jgi:hypothetical protein